MAESDPSAARREWTRTDLISLLVITAIGGVIRFWSLGDPTGIMFDETYYAKDACWYVEANPSLCEVSSEQTLVHPPLGKWLLAVGVRIFGYDAFGWRFAAALAGTVTIPVLYVLARRLLKSTVAASLAAGLLAADFLHFVQSRIAMIDIFVLLFGLPAVLFLVLDRDLRPREGGGPAGLLGRPWRIAAGAAAGAAVASKWSGIFIAAFVILLAAAWAIGARRADKNGRPVRRAVREEGISILLWLVLLPAVVYVGTYVGRLEGSLVGLPWSEGTFWRAVWDQQFAMLSFHTEGIAGTIHPYQSPAWSWPLIKRPVSYFFETNDAGQYMEVMAVGSPLVWWTSLLALVYTGYRWVREPGKAAGVIVGGFLITYLPWVLLPALSLLPGLDPHTDRAAVFLFYLLPSVPFMCLALAFVAARIIQFTEGKVAVGAFAAAALAFFVFFYPVLAKVPLPREQWDQRIRFRACEEKTEEGGPPTGWCWI